MRKRIAVAGAAIAMSAFAGTALATGGGKGLIFDDGHYVQPGSLDDGKALLPQTTISLAQAVSAARGAADGALGQVDLERSGDKIVYSVDVGDREVRVDAGDGSIVSTVAQS